MEVGHNSISISTSFLLTGLSGVCLVVLQTAEMLPDDKLKPIITIIKFPISNES